MIKIPSDLTILVLLSTSPTFSLYPLMLTYTLANFSTTFTDSISISITFISNSRHLYNLINLFNILLIWYTALIGIFSMVVNLIFCWGDQECGVFRKHNILCENHLFWNFYKSIGNTTYYYFYTLIGLCITVLTLMPSRSVPNIYFLLAISFTVIGHLGRNLLLNIPLY